MELVEKIRLSLIGEGQCIPTSFGQKPLIYADYTASGRSLTFIEDAIRELVLPFYANTHTETSFTGAQSTAYREQARDIIRCAVNASDDDQIIFCGSNTTAMNCRGVSRARRSSSFRSHETARSTVTALRPS